MNTTSVDQIFIIENLSLCQHFFSAQKPGATCRVIATDLDVNRRFFGEVVGVERLDLLPQMMAWVHDPKAPPPNHWWRWLDTLRADAEVITRLANSVPTTIPIYWLHAMGPLYLYAMLGRLKKRGNPVFFLSSPLMTEAYLLSFHRCRGDFPDMHPDMLSFLQAASEVTECDLGMVQVQPLDRSWSYFAIGPIQSEPPLSIALKPWAEIAATMRPRVLAALDSYSPGTWEEPTTRPRVLLVEDQISDQCGMYKSATMSFLDRYLERRLEMGEDIFVKPHYQAGALVTDYDPKIKNQLHVLPYYLPAELVLNFFSEICFFKSSTMGTPTSAQRTCLLPLIQFSADARRELYWSILRFYLRPYWDQVTFVAPDGDDFRPRTVNIDGPIPSWCG